LASLPELIDFSFPVSASWSKVWEQIGRSFLANIEFPRIDLGAGVASLLGRIDFGAFDISRGLAKIFEAQQAHLLEALASIRLPANRDLYPPNLKDIDGLTLEEIREVAMGDGIALYRVPRKSTAEALIRAPGASARRQVLGRRWASISADCRACAEGWVSEATVPLRAATLAALDACDSGHTQAAQALTGSLVDTIVRRLLGQDRPKYVESKDTTTSIAYDDLTVGEFIAFAPIWSAHLKFYPSEGAAVPSVFNRHATAHTVSAKQFNRRNTIQALMLACGLISWAEDQMPHSGTVEH
jgi:hypothetical protein